MSLSPQLRDQDDGVPASYLRYTLLPMIFRQHVLVTKVS
jgi:hypothetical protein